MGKRKREKKKKINMERTCGEKNFGLGLVGCVMVWKKNLIKPYWFGGPIIIK